MKQKIIRFFASLFLICSVLVLASCDPNAVGTKELIQLENPSDFTITDEDGVCATWSEVTGASEYVIYIYQDDTCIKTVVASSGYIFNDLESGVYEAGIRTMGDNKTYRSAGVSDKITFEYTSYDPIMIDLTTPTGVEVVYNEEEQKIQITFNDSADYVNAAGYVAYFYQNSSIVKTIGFTRNGDSISISTLNEGTYQVEVKVLGDAILYNDSQISSSNNSITLVGTSGGTGTLEGYYANASDKIGDALETALRTIITTTHTTKTSYDDLKSVLQDSDRDPENSSNIILFYSRASVKSTWDSGNTWNREHVWPNSKGVGKSGPGADAHHLRPTDPSINSSRGNNGFAYVTGGKELTFKGKGTGCYVGGGKFEPADEVKGDVARIIFYLLLRYETLYSRLSEVASLDVMLEWNELDPVDSFEITRNEEVYKVQGNRNPLIDHPEFAELIWGNAYN